MSRRAVAAYDAACDLAADGATSDEGAARQLQRRYRRSDLSVAEINSRTGGIYRDLAVPNRVQRLLVAALNGTPVRTPSEDDMRRFQCVEAFDALPEAERWQRLVRQVPELAGVLEGLPRYSVAEKEDWRNAREDLAVLNGYLDRELPPRVGPDCGSLDPLISSRYAHDFAANYLFEAANTATSNEGSADT